MLEKILFPHESTCHTFIGDFSVSGCVLILNILPAIILEREKAKISLHDNEPPIINIVDVIPITVRLINIILLKAGLIFCLISNLNINK